MSLKINEKKTVKHSNVNHLNINRKTAVSGKKLVFLPTHKSNKMCAVAEGASFGPVAE